MGWNIGNDAKEILVMAWVGTVRAAMWNTPLQGMKRFLTSCVCIFMLVSWSGNAWSQERRPTERDHMSDRSIFFQGSVAILGKTYTISAQDPLYRNSVTFVMNKDKSLLVDVGPASPHAGVLVEASVASSPRLTRAVWAYDDLRSVVRLNTADVWRPLNGCNSSGCPKIRFQATRGTVGIQVVDKKTYP